MESETLKQNVDILQQKLLKKAKPRRSLADVDDDEFNRLDLTNYALKYLGCQNIRQFDDNLAEAGDTGTVLGVNKFVVFRLCNAQKCSTYNKYGCNNDFGEYVMKLEDYLEIMEQYHYEKFLEYCATCIECMTPPDDDGLDYNQTDDVLNTTNETVAWNAAYDCEYYSACSNYQRACKKFDSTNSDDDNKQFFLSCNAFNVGNDVQYIGPHCSDDGYTITTGIFKDEDCTEFVGNQINLAYYSGINVDNTNLGFYSSPSCISCLNKNSYALYDDDNDGNEAYELCDYLFRSSAQCNRYMSYDENDIYLSEQQAENEGKVCNFVESLIENNYDEYGEIMLGFGETFNIANWYLRSEYQNVTGKISSVQVIGLIFSVTLVFGLFIYAAYLHSKVTRIWRPTKQYPKYPVEDYDATRSASGIKMVRSKDQYGIGIKDSFNY